MRILTFILTALFLSSCNDEPDLHCWWSGNDYYCEWNDYYYQQPDPSLVPLMSDEELLAMDPADPADAAIVAMELEERGYDD